MVVADEIQNCDARHKVIEPPRFTLILAGQAPIASGGKSDVYEHPQYRDILVKVIRERRVQYRLAKMIGRRRRFGYILDYLRCIEQQAAVWASEGDSARCLERAHGFIATDYGIGLLVNAERLGEELAPTLGSLVRNGQMNDSLTNKLYQFFNLLIDSPVVINDLAFENVVLSEEPDGVTRFILIDGYGDTAFIPIRSWSNWVNRRSKIKACNHIRAKLADKIRSVKALPLDEGSAVRQALRLS